MSDYLIDGQLVDDEKDGDWVEYFANGNKRREGKYVDGKKEGKWILYHPNGNKKSEGTFRNGLFEGWYVAYHKNGHKFRAGDYGPHEGKSYDGRKEGVWHDYAQDGKTVRQQVTYKHGKIVERMVFEVD
jgi:antitoxin component YwqK of YwqJK toxin-antitoxin module